MALQPLLHDLLAVVAAPTQAWSGSDGQVRPTGAHGVYHGDTRVLSSAVLVCDGVEPEVLTAGQLRPGAVEVLALLRTADGPGADPTVRLRRVREVGDGVLTETLTVEAAGGRPVACELAVRLACDLAVMDAVKAGHAGSPVPAVAAPDGVRWDGPGVAVTVRAAGASVDLTDASEPVLRWRVVVAPGEAWSGGWGLAAAGPTAVLATPSGAVWAAPWVACDDRRLPALLAQSLADLHGLRMRAEFAPEDVFLAAGAPWFFTLFGRDSIWAARMLLPLGTRLAAGTLRTLAARQGRVVDPRTAEEPGKILHEVRSAPVDLGEDGRVLPPLYYGTVDATPLWVCLLHDAWRWGMPEPEVEALLPAMEAALGWITDHGDADGDGFLEYLDATGSGLANQGWKDSGDSVQWRDGSLATGPIALCEVQGYAHEAALAGATLLDAFGRPGADRWRSWAADLAARFRARFWVRDDRGPYPAIALDAAKRPVDSLTSNIGHLLGTGLLSADEEAVVADRLGSPALDSGYGLRTLAEGSGGYWPLRYHGGTVWAHDTAIAVHGLARAGRTEVAAALTEGLLAAAADVGYRLPELHAGDARGSVPAVVPYPAACRPQAWAAASAVVLVSGLLGLRADAPGGTMTVAPVAPSPVGALRVAGLRVADAELTVAVDADGRVTEAAVGGGLRLVRADRSLG